MSIAATRVQIAATIDANLPTVKVRAYKPQTSKPSEGWLEIRQTDTEESTYGEVRLSMVLVIPLSTSRQSFEKAQDALTVPIIAAVKAAGGRGPVVTLAVESVGQADLYTLTTTFVTESEAA